MFRSVRTRITVVFVVSVLVFGGLAGYFGYRYLRWNEHRMSDEIGRNASDICAATYDYYLKTYGDLTPGSDAYVECRKELRNICQQSLMDYLYVYEAHPENGTVKYLMCVAADDELDQKVQEERAYGTVVDHELTQLEWLAFDDSLSREAEVVDNEYGFVLTWFSNVDSAKTTTLAAADYSVVDQRERVLHSTLLVLAPLIGGMLLVLLIQMHELKKHVFGPLRVIAERMRSFSARDARHLEPVGITTNDEMGEIAGAFEGMAHDIDEYLDDIDELTAQRVQAEVEIGVARRIQRGVVPTLTQRSFEGLDICAFSHPARKVGGDFYIMFPRSDGTAALVVGDVSGKGMAAALFMGMVSSMSREGLMAGRGPKETLERVNTLLTDSNPEGLFVSMFAAVFDPRDGRVTFCNAGHMPPLVVGRDVRRLKVDSGELVGLYDDIELVEESLTLTPGESLLLFTDGVNEATNDANEFMGMERFVDALEAHLPFACAFDLADEAVWAVKVFAEGSEQFDDLTVAVIRRDDVAQ